MRNRWRSGLGDFSDCLLAGLLVALASVPVVTAAPAFVAGCRILDRTRHDVGRPLWTKFWADFREAARGGVLFGLGCLAAVVVFAVDLAVAASMPGAGVLRPALWLLAAAGAVVALRTCELVATGGGSAGHRETGTPGGAPRAPAGANVAGAGGLALLRKAGPARPGEPAQRRGVLWKAAPALPGGPAWRRGVLRKAEPALPGEPARRRGVLRKAGPPLPGGPAWRRALVTAARETAAAPASGLLLAVAAGLAVLLVWMLPILALVVAGPLALAAVATGGRR